MITANGAPAAPTGKNGITLDAFVSLIYLPDIKIRKRSWKIDERVARQRLSPVFGGRNLSAIRCQEVDSWLRGLLEGGLAPATCNRFLAVFKTICSFAQSRGFLDKSPCHGIAALKVHRQRCSHLCLEDARRLMRALENSMRPEAFALRLILLTGARKNEILRARWENVDIANHILTVPVSKSGRPRTIALSGAAMAVIGQLPKKWASPWLFPGRVPGKPLSDIYIFWNMLRRELKLEDIRIHDLRHTFASLLVNSGHSLYEVQRLLGHADPRTSMRYAHLGPAPLLAAADAVGAFLAKNTLKIKNGRSKAASRIWRGRRPGRKAEKA